MIGRFKTWCETGWSWVRNQDLLVLLLSLGVALGAWAFIELVDEVREGSTLGIDERSSVRCGIRRTLLSRWGRRGWRW